MSLSPRDPQSSFFEVSFPAANLCDGRDPYGLFRREILPALEAQRDLLGAMYRADNGRPPLDPVLVAGVTLLQFMEKAPDRQAVQHLRLHLGWKHALGLAVDYAGFHPTSLVYFRQRLLAQQQTRCVFDALLQGLEQKGLVRRRGKQKTTAWVGYKAQIAETVGSEETGAKPKGAPTSPFITEITTTEAIARDLDGRVRLEQQQEQHGLGRAAEGDTDSAYVTDDTLARASAEGRPLLGPARPSGKPRDERFPVEQFDVSIAERRAICPAGHASTPCRRLENQQTGQVDYRFEWSSPCDTCPLQSQCTKAGSGRRAVVVSQYHDLRKSFDARLGQRAAVRRPLDRHTPSSFGKSA